MLESALTIRALTARAVAAPLARPLRTASGDVPVSPLLLVDVASEEGPAGRAYVFGYTTLTLRALKAFLEDVEEVVRGRAASPAAVYDDLAARFRLMGRQGLVGMALSGLDMALWDLQGRAQERPVVELLGGRAKPVPAYDSFGIVDPAADRAALERSVEQGFRAIKIKIGVGDLAWDVARVAGVREIIGPDVRLMVDYNQSLTAPEALRRIRALARFDLEWVEEPVPAEDLAGHARVRAASPVPIQTGENWWFGHDMAHAPRGRRLRPLHAGPDEDGRRDGLASRHGAGRGGRRARVEPSLHRGQRPRPAGDAVGPLPGVPGPRRRRPRRPAAGGRRRGDRARAGSRHGLGRGGGGPLSGIAAVARPRVALCQEGAGQARRRSRVPRSGSEAFAFRRKSR